LAVKGWKDCADALPTPSSAPISRTPLILSGLLLAAGGHAAFLLINARLEAGVESLHAPYFADLVGTFGRTFVRARALAVGLAFFGTRLFAKHRTGPDSKGESRRQENKPHLFFPVA
jgi:hypothetical protein